MPTLSRRGRGHHAKKDPGAPRTPGRKRLRRPGEAHIQRGEDERRNGRGVRARARAL